MLFSSKNAGLNRSSVQSEWKKRITCGPKNSISFLLALRRVLATMGEGSRGNRNEDTITDVMITNKKAEF